MSQEQRHSGALADLGDEVSNVEVDDPIIEVRDARVSFDMDRGESRVLDDVDLDLERGEILGVVGESGSGKSMLASALLDAVVDPGQLSGDIAYYPTPDTRVDLLELSESELRETRWEEISMVFQGAMSSFNPVKKIRGSFRETLESHGYDVAAGMDRARDLLADLYLDADRVLDSYPHELSGGMRQRALLALSMVLEPEVLVMDEPTAALDLLMQRSILILLEELQEKYDLTILFITHDLPLVASLADRIAVMYAFQLVEIAPTEDILRHASHPYTRELLNSTPNIDAPLDEMQSIEGASPDPVNAPTGCSYHPRCPLANDVCVEREPAYLLADDDHGVACYHWRDARRTMPLNHLDESADTSPESYSDRGERR